MTKQQAINELQDILGELCNTFEITDNTREAVKMAVAALENDDKTGYCNKFTKSKAGHWMYDSFYGGYYICSECGHTQGSKSLECPQCHTKMEVKNE